jgi:hypothetical protein
MAGIMRPAGKKSSPVDREGYQKHFMIVYDLVVYDGER